MRYEFTKEIFPQYILHDYGLLYNCRLYKVFAEGKITGQFFCSDKVAYMAYEDMDIRIDIQKRFLRRTQHIIVDQKLNVALGCYDIKNQNNNRKSSGKMMLGEEWYVALTLDPDVKWKLFDSKTWRYHKVKVYNEKEEAVYALRLGITKFLGPSDNDLLPASGYVELSSSNLLLLFAGLYLVEKTLWVSNKQALIETR